MDADLDTLATALYVKIDQLLLDAPERLPWRPRVGITPRISDAEVITLCVMQALLSFTSEARWLRHAHADLRHLSPHLPQQPGYNKRLRKLAGTVNWLIRQLAADTASGPTTSGGSTPPRSSAPAPAASPAPPPRPAGPS